MADFDGDTRPDIATVEVGRKSAWGSRYWVAFRLSGGSRQTLGITAPPGGIQLASRDVNGDDFPDVIVTTAWTNQPVAVLLNDGRGNFTVSEASRFPGAFSAPENTLVSKKDGTNDTFAALLSRGLFGHHEPRSEVLTFHTAARLLIPRTSCDWLSCIVESFRDRAPPLLIPKV